MPEPNDGKLSRSVPRGREAGNGLLLPGHLTRAAILVPRDTSPLQAAPAGELERSRGEL
jgi:hypothetical protein